MNAMVTIRECIAEAGRRLGATKEQIEDSLQWSDANNPTAVGVSHQAVIPKDKSEEVIAHLMTIMKWALDNPVAALEASRERHEQTLKEATKN